MEHSSEWPAILNALELWPDIQQFLFRAKVNSNYLKEVEKFQSDVEKFYEYGAETFLSNKKGDEGGKESVYLHLLRFNIATHAKITYERHGVGIGIFNLQSYERQNRHSKNQFVKHCNMKGNVCIQVLLQLNRQFEILNLPREKKRKKQQRGPPKFRVCVEPSRAEPLDNTVLIRSI